MTSHSSSVLAQAGLVLLLSAAVVVPWLAAGGSSLADCERKCGGVDIPFPFGWGPDDGCWLPGFQISCDDTGYGVLKPFMTIGHPTKTDPNAEILNISLDQGQVRVLHPISSYCYDATSREMVPDGWHWHLRGSRYTFSSTANTFTVVGCHTLAYIGDTTSDSTRKYKTGCVSLCFQGNLAVNPCSGMGCCQTAIPQGLQSYVVSFDESLSLAGIQGGRFGPCSFAVLMMNSHNFSLSSNLSNLSTGFNTSLGGKAPVVLEWSIGDDGCENAVTSPGYACLSDYSSCYNAASGRGYICNCTQGFEGNPYLPNGCKDIDECQHQDKYPCHGVCKNTFGSFTCDCPTGTQGNASNAECQKHPFSFPLGARVGTGISVGVLVALIAFLATEVFRHKASKKRQGYFEQHGGQMLLRILQTEQNNISFTLYDRKDLVKATRGFHTDYIVGEGAHGTVYKATLSGAAADASSNTVAVKRCKQIDETMTKEFVQELVVLCRVNHPNVVRLLGCCLHFEAPMLVYEFVPNGTLRDLLHQRPRRRVTLPTRLRIAAETAEALKHLHSPPHPTLHGDVKPENILLGDGWVTKVSDFGCSTINDNVQVVPKGSLAYLDPEFLQDNQITEKTDIYSFGVVLIELLTGKDPQARGFKNLIRMFQNCMANGTLGDLLDADIVEEGSVGLIYAAAKLVSQCIVVPGKARPAMAQVAEELRRFSNEMPESPEGDTTGFSNHTALSTELAR